jgi:hypothetical protein
MKLQQGQIWKTCPSVHGHNDRPLYLRIVTLERLAVAYKEQMSADASDGQHKSVTKKTFCRLLKKATLLNP